MVKSNRRFRLCSQKGGESKLGQNARRVSRGAIDGIVRSTASKRENAGRIAHMDFGDIGAKPLGIALENRERSKASATRVRACENGAQRASNRMAGWFCSVRRFSWRLVCPRLANDQRVRGA